MIIGTADLPILVDFDLYWGSQSEQKAKCVEFISSLVSTDDCWNIPKMKHFDNSVEGDFFSYKDITTAYWMHQKNEKKKELPWLAFECLWTEFFSNLTCHFTTLLYLKDGPLERQIKGVGLVGRPKLWWGNSVGWQGMAWTRTAKDRESWRTGRGLLPAVEGHGLQWNRTE